MKTETVIKNLTTLNEWRRGGQIEQPDPAEVSKTIDEAIRLLSGMLERSRIKGKGK